MQKQGQKRPQIRSKREFFFEKESVRQRKERNIPKDVVEETCEVCTVYCIDNVYKRNKKNLEQTFTKTSRYQIVL